jgi:glycine hydroxymethyltransferase
MVLLDLSPQNLPGNKIEEVLERAGMTCNKNAIPNDPLGPRITSGIRLGTPAITTRGFAEKEVRKIGQWIAEIINATRNNKEEEIINKIREQTLALCAAYPLYTH